MSEFFFPPLPNCRGVLVDNDARVQPHLIDEGDRTDKMHARAVFNSLFPLAKEVRIKSVWRVQIDPRSVDGTVTEPCAVGQS